MGSMCLVKAETGVTVITGEEIDELMRHWLPKVDLTISEEGVLGGATGAVDPGGERVEDGGWSFVHYWCGCLNIHKEICQ